VSMLQVPCECPRCARLKKPRMCRIGNTSEPQLLGGQGGKGVNETKRNEKERHGYVFVRYSWVQAGRKVRANATRDVVPKKRIMQGGKENATAGAFRGQGVSITASGTRTENKGQK